MIVIFFVVYNKPEVLQDGTTDTGIKCMDVRILPYSETGLWSGDQSGNDDPEPNKDEIWLSYISDNINETLLDDDCYRIVLAANDDTELDNDKESPLTYSLSAIYPNPFNPSTTMEWTMLSASNHELSVYNVNGQLVDVVSSGLINQGSHSITWTPNSLSTGVYFVRLTVENEIVDSRKVMLLK